LRVHQEFVISLPREREREGGALVNKTSSGARCCSGLLSMACTEHIRTRNQSLDGVT